MEYGRFGSPMINSYLIEAGMRARLEPVDAAPPECRCPVCLASEDPYDVYRPLLEIA